MRTGAGALTNSWAKTLKQIRVPFPSLARVVELYAGESIVVIAAPGVGKTLFALNFAAQSGAKTLYLSADTSERNVSLNLAAMATGELKEDIKKAIKETNPDYREAIKDYEAEIRKAFPNLIVDNSPSISLEAVVQKSYALADIWGDYPELLVLDIATNIERPSDDYGSWDQLWNQIKMVARHLGCGVLVLHHVKEGYAANGNVAPQLSDGQYKPHKHLEIELGLYRPGPHEFRVIVLKNRDGKDQVTIPMVMDYPTATLIDNA